MKIKLIKYKIFKYYVLSANVVQGFVQRLQMTEHLYMMIIAAIIGIVGGFGAVAVKAGIHFISDLTFFGGVNLIDSVVKTPWYWVILIPAIGGAIVGPLVHFLGPETRGHGVPEVMHSVLTKGGIIRPRVAVIKAIASAVTIGTGGSVGKEGPIVQIGSSLGSMIGQFLRVPSSRLKILVGCGAAAGIAGAFNAPVAGALFAIEIILLDFAVSSFSPIVISAVIATVVSHGFEGNFAAFIVSNFEWVSPWEVLFYIVLGGLAGIVSYIFIKILYSFEDFWDNKIKIQPYIKPIIGGAIVGLTALIFPEIIGVGYDAINSAINNQGLSYNGLGNESLASMNSNFLNDSLWYMALVLIFVKMFASSITLASGLSGGIFAPSLFVGAMLGAFFGYVVNMFFPEYAAHPGAYSLVAMGGLVAGTTRAPITAILIVFELTKENDIILPLMLTCIGSVIVSTKLSRESIYTLKLLQKNINFKDRAESNVLKTIFVNDIINKSYKVISEVTKFSDVVSKLLSHKVPILFVHNSKQQLIGIITLNDIKDFLFERDELNEILIAGDIANSQYAYLHSELTCKEALAVLNKTGQECLPVLKNDGSLKQLGVVWRKDIDFAHQKELERLEITSDLATKIMLNNDEKQVHFLDGYLVSEVKVPKGLIGKSLIEARIRNNYGIDVLSIKQIVFDGLNSKNVIKAIPDATQILKENDILVVAGETEKINKFKSLS